MSINPVQAQAQMHAQDAYAAPVLRPASPASSVGTAYPPDATSPEDAELTDAQFDEQILTSLRLNGQQRFEEQNADQDPLLTLTHVARQRPVEEFERQILHDRIMTNLRMRVRALEENEIFDQILLRGSRIGLEPSSSSNDVDAILTSMMGPSMNLNRTPSSSSNIPFPSSGSRQESSPAHLPFVPELQPLALDPLAPDVTPGPWNNFGKGLASRQPPAFDSIPFPTPQKEDFMESSSGTSTPQAQVGGKRSRNGASRSKKRT